MFRRHAFRASRTAYLASVGAVGTVVAEAAQGDREDQSTPVEAVPAPEPPQDVVSPELPRPVLLSLPDKLSIYPSPTPTLVLLDTPSPLERQIGHVRQVVCGHYADARGHVQGLVDRWIHIERSVESRLKSFRDPAEPLNPGLLYTGITALTASVVVRTRALPVRVLVPPLSLVGACAYFLPLTTGRVGAWVEELEGAYVPRVGEVRRTSVAHTRMALGMLGEKYAAGKAGLEHGARRLVDEIERGTGLRVRGALGWDTGKDKDKDKVEDEVKDRRSDDKDKDKDG